MCEYLVDDRLVLDRSNHTSVAAAEPTFVDISVENSLESLCPGHGHMTVSLFVLLALLCCVPPTSFSSPCWRD